MGADSRVWGLSLAIVLVIALFLVNNHFYSAPRAPSLRPATPQQQQLPPLSFEQFQYKPKHERKPKQQQQRQQRILEEVCGKPTAEALVSYARFHEDVLQQETPWRSLVSVPVEAGLADRLTGVISLFWLSFFSKRAFFISRHEKLPHFEEAFDYVFINWTKPSYYRNNQIDPSQRASNSFTALAARWEVFKFNQSQDNVTHSSLDDHSNFTAVSDHTSSTRSLLVEDLEAPLLYTYRGKRGYIGPRYYNADVDQSLYHMEYMINDVFTTRRVFRNSDLPRYPFAHRPFPQESHVFASSNRGGIRFLFENPSLSKIFQHLQLPKESAFRCAYHFLFAENADVRSLMASQWDIDLLSAASRVSVLSQKSSAVGVDDRVWMSPQEVLPSSAVQQQAIAPPPVRQSKPSSVRIGLGIRVGDHSFNPVKDARTTLTPFEGFFLCARESENTIPADMRGVSQEPALWFVVAESLKFRQLVHERHANDSRTVLVDHETTYWHGDCADKSTGGCGRTHLRQSIVAAVAQLTAFSLCDVHVIGSSGFPRLGAMLSKPPHRIFMMKNESDPKCNFSAPINWDTTTSFGCGI